MTVRARIYWLSPEDGGRDRPPSALYSTVARFADERGDWSNEAWSLVLEDLEPTDSFHCVLASVRFLSPSGPAELLNSGSSFELFEGRKKVATGIVL
jgi:hypothetical protein